jgi:hypothetical protein
MSKAVKFVKVVEENRPQLVVGPFTFWYYVCPVCGRTFTAKDGLIDGEVLCLHCEKGDLK